MTFDPDELELSPEVAAFLESLVQEGFAIESGVPNEEYFGDVIVSAKKGDLALRLVREKSIWDLDVLCVGVPYATYYWRVCMNDMSFEQAILPFEARLTWALQNLDVLAQLSSPQLTFGVVSKTRSIVTTSNALDSRQEGSRGWNSLSRTSGPERVSRWPAVLRLLKVGTEA